MRSIPAIPAAEVTHDEPARIHPRRIQIRPLINLEPNSIVRIPRVQCLKDLMFMTLAKILCAHRSRERLLLMSFVMPPTIKYGPHDGLLVNRNRV
jgi:hypothetical protein